MSSNPPPGGFSGANPPAARANLVWRGRPSVGVLVIFYGIIALMVLIVLVTVEYWVGSFGSVGGAIFPHP